MKLLEWIGEHPFLTVILLIVVGGVTADIIRALVGRCP